MARYRHVVSGALVDVRDDKVLDSSWEPADDEKKAKRSTTRTAKSTKSDDES